MAVLMLHSLIVEPQTHPCALHSGTVRHTRQRGMLEMDALGIGYRHPILGELAFGVPLRRVSGQPSYMHGLFVGCKKKCVRAVRVCPDLQDPCECVARTHVSTAKTLTIIHNWCCTCGE